MLPLVLFVVMVCISRIVMIPIVVIVRIVPPIVTVRIIIWPVPLKSPIKWKVPRIPIRIVIRPIRSIVWSLMKPMKPSTIVCVVIISHISVGFFYHSIFYNSIIIDSPVYVINLGIS
jgi:hypothetical protein